MSRSVRNVVRTCLVWTIVLLMTFDTAMACRLLGSRRQAKRGCCVPVVCCQPASCCDSAPACNSEDENSSKDLKSASDDSAAGLDKPNVTSKEPGTISPSDARPVQNQVPVERPAKSLVTPKSAKPKSAPSKAKSDKNVEPTVKPAVRPAEPAPRTTENDQPTVQKPTTKKPESEKTATPTKNEFDELFNDKPNDTSKAKAPPATEKPAPEKDDAGDLFGDSPKVPATPVVPIDKPTTPAKESVDDLFGDAPAKPAQKKDDLDDLFGDAPKEPAKPVVPAEKPPTPSKESVDDLFRDAPVKPAEVNTPAPNTDRPKADPEDLFEDTTKDAPKPSAPAKPSAESNLKPRSEQAPKTDAVDDLFDEPSKETAKSVPAGQPKDTVDELFGDAPKSATAEPAEKPRSKKSDDPFEGASLQNEPLPIRLWTDNTSNFRVQGRLIAILDGKVRLLKDTGKTCTVPLNRLCEQDLHYVESTTAQIGGDQLAQIAGN